MKTRGGQPKNYEFKSLNRSLFRQNYGNKTKTYLDYLWKSDYMKRTKMFYTKNYKDMVKYEYENV